MVNFPDSSVSINNLRRVVLILFILNCVSGYLLHNENLNGYNAYQFFFMYIVGSWIRKEPFVKSKSKPLFIFSYLVSCMILSMIAIGILSFTNSTLQNLYSYNNPLTVIVSVALFLFFTKFSFKNNLVNILASTVVAALFMQLILMRVFSTFIHSHPVYFTPVYILVIFLLAFIIEYPRKRLTESLLLYLSKKKFGTFINRPIILDDSKNQSVSYTPAEKRNP